MIDALVTPPGILAITLFIYSLPVFKKRGYNIEKDKIWLLKIYVFIAFIMWCFVPTFGLIPILHYLNIVTLTGWPEYFFEPVSLDSFWLLVMSSSTLFYLMEGIKVIRRSSREG
jgi:hypothetical protein